MTGQSIERAVAIVGPAVIKAGEMPGVALWFAAHQRTTMAAGIEIHAHRIAAVAAKNQRAATDGARFEIARRAYLGLVADINPAHIKNAAAFEFKHLRIDKCGAIDREVHRFRLVDDPGAIVRSVHAAD